MRKTKIICTLGPATDKEGVLRGLVENGMNVARFNFSHGSHEEHKGRLDALKAIREELDKPAAALVVEEPGLNSHAAIVAKALLKPAIVGAQGATSHIRDGLDIAVDCAHGSVQALQA